MLFYDARVLAFLVLLVPAVTQADEAKTAATQPTVKTVTTNPGHDIAPLPGGKVAPISQSDKDNVNKIVDYFERKLRPRSRSQKGNAAKPPAKYPAATSNTTSK